MSRRVPVLQHPPRGGDRWRPRRIWPICAAAPAVPEVRWRDEDHRLHHRDGAFITEGPVIQAIPGHLGEPTSPPRLRPARGPPLWAMQDRGADAINPHAQPMPDLEFGKRVAWQGARRQGSLAGGDACLRPPARATSAALVATGTDNGHAGAGFSGSFSTTFKIDHN